MNEASRAASIRLVPRASHIALALVLVIPLVAGLARADDAPEDALTARTRAFSPAELRAVEPLLDRAIVTYIEMTEFVELPQVTVLGRADVSCREVLATARDVASYPRFMPATGTVAIEASTPTSIGYEWTWQASILSFRGRTLLTAMADGDGSAGFRLVYETHSGDLGRARRVIRGTPLVGGDGAERCQLQLVGRQDIRDANYIAREASGSALTMSRSLSLVLAIGTVARLRGEAERRAGVVRPRIEWSTGDPRALDVDVRALAPLLHRGEMFIIETTDGSDLGTVVGLARMFTFLPEPIRRAFRDPVRFTVGLIRGASITELEELSDGARYRWDVNVPFLGSSGELTIRDVSESEIELEATRGAMRGGRIVLTTYPDDDGVSAYVSLATRLNPADGMPVIAAIESTDGSFRPGLVSSGLLMAIRGLRRGLNEGN